MSKKTLVFGASMNPDRYSNMAIRKLVNSGHATVAFGLKNGVQYGVNIETELITYPDLDTVTLYMNANNQKQYYDYLIGLKPKRIIFNPGSENPDFYETLNSHNIEIEVACTLVLLSTDQY